MVKTNVPSEFQFGNNTIATNALPDPFDALDLQYRPKLQMLPPVLDGRAGKVLDQKGQSCTGHAVAALIDTVNSLPLAKEPPERPAPTPDDQAQLARTCSTRLPASTTSSPATPTSGRRFAARSRAGTTTGSARRGPGATPPPPNPDLDDLGFIAECMKTPLGAYYRVNARRLDDMQSALTELNALAASAAIHEGWRKPVREMHERQADLGHPPPRGPRARAAGRPRVPARRLQRRRLPRPELVGHDVGPPRLRDAALCRLARQRVRRVGRPARRPAGRHRPAAAQGDPRRRRLRRWRRHGPGPAQVVRGQRDGGRPDGHEGQGDERPGPDRRRSPRR